MNINFNLAYLAMTSKQQEKHMPPQKGVLTKEKKKVQMPKNYNLLRSLQRQQRQKNSAAE